MTGKKIPVLVADGVLDTFVEDAVAAHDKALGLTGRPTASTDLAVHQDNAVSRMTDGDDSTYFWSAAAPRSGSTVGLDLHAERPLGTVTLAMGKSGSPDDFLRHGVLEYSSDRKNWQKLAAFDGNRGGRRPSRRPAPRHGMCAPVPRRRRTTGWWCGSSPSPGRSGAR